MPGDLLKFGLIPEFIGRIPIIVTLSALDQDALIKVLSKPKNALVKQYKKLFQLDNVELEFEEESLKAIAKEAIARNTGARGLRAIVEEMLKDAMFDIPSREDVEKVVVNEESVKSKKLDLVLSDGTKKISTPKKTDDLKNKKGIETA